MVIFNSYVKLPEGSSCYFMVIHPTLGNQLAAYLNPIILPHPAASKTLGSWDVPQTGISEPPTRQILVTYMPWKPKPFLEKKHRNNPGTLHCAMLLANGCDASPIFGSLWQSVPWLAGKSPFCRWISMNCPFQPPFRSRICQPWNWIPVSHQRETLPIIHGLYMVMKNLQPQTGPGQNIFFFIFLSFWSSFYLSFFFHLSFHSFFFYHFIFHFFIILFFIVLSFFYHFIFHFLSFFLSFF